MSNSDKDENYNAVKQIAQVHGGAKFGVADLDGYRFNFHEFRGYKYGISVAVRLSDGILKTLKQHATALYAYHYRQINFVLDQLATHISLFVQNRGYAALPIPASQFIDWSKMLAHLSHRDVAVRAGLGWIGRNNLLVTPEFGSRVRLVTVLTDMPLRTDTEIEFGCGNCYACVNACPANAIQKKPEDFNAEKCISYIRETKKANALAQFICGVCQKVCYPPSSREIRG